MPAFRFRAAACGFLLAMSAPAWPFGNPAVPVPAVEYFNADLGHYFMTASAEEMRAIDEGRAGAGWRRTGFTFDVYAKDLVGYYGNQCSTEPSPCAPVSRFYGKPGQGPNSHFFTANLAEVDFLSKPASAWAFEGVAFYVRLPQGTSGECASGLSPIHRLYNNRWMLNDSNHRYTGDAEVRARMVAQGWSDEGVAFCAQAAGRAPIRSHLITIAAREAAGAIGPIRECEDESRRLGSCMALSNLPTPLVPIDPVVDRYSGMLRSVTLALSSGSRAEIDQALSVSFTDNDYGYFGIHLSTRPRGPSPFSSVSPQHTFRTTPPAPGQHDARFFPWSPARERDVELVFASRLNLRALTVTPGSHAFGHAILEFADTRSGRRFDFAVQAYGTLPESDSVGVDVKTGKVIVGTGFRTQTRYGRIGPYSSQSTPPGFLGDAGFSFHMDRTEFERVLVAARTLDPALSSRPEDYVVGHFRFQNEVYGDGDIRVDHHQIRLSLLLR